MAESTESLRRMPALLRAWLRTLPSPDSPTLYLGPAAEDHTIDKKALKQTNLNEVMVDFLIDMHDKLELVLNLLSFEQFAGQFPMRADVVEIGGSGLTLVPAQQLTEGDTVEVLIMMQQFPMRLAGAVGQIGQEVDTRLGKARQLHFLRIREEDQEAIVQFVFQEERRTIRQLRWD